MAIFSFLERSGDCAGWVLAANQGLYNGFLAVGLFWGLLLGQRAAR